MVGVSEVLALRAVAALAIVGGRSLVKVLPLGWSPGTAGEVMLVLAAVSAAAAIA